VEPVPLSPNQTVGERTAANLRAELARRKLSGRDLAKACRWSSTTAWRRLTGEVPMTVDELAAVAEWLAIPVNELMGVEDRSPVAVA
jgi:transcriptional regulator with XRE-family HTH domain